MRLDQLDIRIIEMLQSSDMLAPKLSKIAKSLGTTTATVYRRIEMLKKEGVITGHTTKIDANLVGANLQSFIYLKLSKSVAKDEKEEITSKLSGMGEVEGLYIPMSNWNYLLHTRHSSIAELNTLIQEKLMLLPIEDMQIEIISRVIKEGAVILPKLPKKE